MLADKTWDLRETCALLEKVLNALWDTLAPQIVLNTCLLPSESSPLVPPGFSNVSKWLSAGLYFADIYKQQMSKACNNTEKGSY